MKRWLWALIALSVLAGPTAALARVGVSGTAKAPLIRAALGAGAPSQCGPAYISSIDKAWAAVFYKPAKGWSARCKTFRKSAWTALHHARGHWRVFQTGDSDACVAVHVPVVIRKDLQIPCFRLLP